MIFARKLVPWLVAALGCAIAWYPTLGSFFARMQFDVGDARFCHYVLEHGYRWVAGYPGHPSFWDAPFYHPAPNVTAYSDILLGAAPLYWLMRVVGLEPGITFQLWQILLDLLCFGAAYLWFRRRFGATEAAAAAGALLFAFGNPRNAQISHIQLHPHFFAIGAIESAWRLLEGRGGRWAFAAAACVVAQLYAGYYLGWMLAVSFIFALPAAAAIAASGARGRAAVLQCARSVREAWASVAVAAALSGLALWPMASHFLEAGRAVGFRTYAWVSPPFLQTWLFAGTDNIEGAWLRRFFPMNGVPDGIEHQLGVGLVTTALLAWGLVGGLRRKRVPVLLAGVAAIWFALATMWPGGFHPWRAIFDLIPGAEGIRALGRVGFAVAPLGALGLALGFDFLLTRLRARFQARPALPAAVGAALLAVIAFEQARHAPSFDRAEVEAFPAALARKVSEQKCATFYYSPTGRPAPIWQVQLDAMWAGVLAGVPTVNGYSGSAPPGYGKAGDGDFAAARLWAARNGVILHPECIFDEPR